jgi:hypothetical protein
LFKNKKTKPIKLVWLLILNSSPPGVRHSSNGQNNAQDHGVGSQIVCYESGIDPDDFRAMR